MQIEAQRLNCVSAANTSNSPSSARATAAAPLADSTLFLSITLATTVPRAWARDARLQTDFAQLLANMVSAAIEPRASSLSWLGWEQVYTAATAPRYLAKLRAAGAFI